MGGAGDGAGARKPTKAFSAAGGIIGLKVSFAGNASTGMGKVGTDNKVSNRPKASLGLGIVSVRQIVNSGCIEPPSRIRRGDVV